MQLGTSADIDAVIDWRRGIPGIVAGSWSVYEQCYGILTLDVLRPAITPSLGSVGRNF